VTQTSNILDDFSNISDPDLLIPVILEIPIIVIIWMRAKAIQDRKGEMGFPGILTWTRWVCYFAGSIFFMPVAQTADFINTLFFI
jgi:hypothetical protein